MASERSGMDLETAHFSVPGVGASRHALDLTNALLSVAGVGQVRVDLASRTVSVWYDDAYISEENLGKTIEAAGYPLQRREAAR